MKIIYKQSEDIARWEPGISHCYFKQLSHTRDSRTVTLNPHHHTDYEVHLICRGSHAYEIGDNVIQLQAGMFLLIPPGVRHRVLGASEDMQKYSITFHSDYRPACDHWAGPLTERMQADLKFIGEEAGKTGGCARQLIGGCVLELILLLLRTVGYEGPETPPLPEESGEDERMALARRYIADNVERSISVEDVAYYCHLSTRQLARLFWEQAGVSPARYLQAEKMQAVRQSLLTEKLTSRQLSEKYGYSSEYYFCKAFKKYYGMSPGAYRKAYAENE